MANPETSPAPPSAGAVCAAGAVALAVAMGIGRFAFTPMLPLMIHEGQLDIATAGWIASANYAGYLLGAMTASRLPWSAARVCLIALAFTALLTAAMALPVSPWLWAAMRLAAGACSAWVFVSTAVWCLGALASMQRPSWSAAVYAGVGGGIALAGLYCLGGASAGATATLLWLQLGVLALVLAAPVALVLNKLPASGVTPRANATSAAGAASTRGTTGITVCYGALGFGYILPATFLPVLARSVVDDPRLFGLAWPVFGLTAAASTFIAGWALRRYSRLQVWAASNVLMGAGVLLPSLWLNGLTIALAAMLVGGTFMVVTMAGVQEVRARVAGDPTPFVGRMTASFALGQIAGPIASSLLHHVPSLAAIGLDLALQAAAASLLLSAAWLWREDHHHFIDPEVSHAR